MANDVYQTVSNCTLCARFCEQNRRKRHLQLFLAAEPLAFIALDVLGTQPQTKNGNIFILLITDRKWKLKRANPASKMTDAHVASFLLDHWIVPYGILDHLLAENSPHFVSYCFATLRKFL